MRVANNVEMLEVEAEGMVFNPVLVWDDKDTVLIDCTLPGKLDVLKEAISACGKRLDDVGTLILTHQDLDHVGCAREIRELGVRVMAHSIEAPYIQGDTTPVRLADMEANKEQSKYAEGTRKTIEACFVKVDRPLEDGEVLDIAGGIRVIHTPGHMPGHISLHLLAEDIVVTADASISVEGKLAGPDVRFTKQENMAEANASLEKLRAVKPKSYICFHGGQAAE